MPAVRTDRLSSAGPPWRESKSVDHVSTTCIRCGCRASRRYRIDPRTKRRVFRESLCRDCWEIAPEFANGKVKTSVGG